MCLCECACMHVCRCMCVRALTETRRGCQVPWNWSYRHLRNPLIISWGQDLNSGPRAACP